MSVQSILKWLIFCWLTLIACSSVLASGGQRFGADAYSNPAYYIFTTNNQFMLGGLAVIVDIPFSGTVGGSPPFEASSNASYVAPNFRYIRRLHEQILVGVEIDEPTISTVGYPADSPAAFVNTNSNQRSLNFGGNLVYQPVKWFGVAFGPDFLYRSTTVALKIPSEQAPQGAILDGQASAWTSGWHVGVVVVVGKATILGLSHHSKMVSDLQGMSEYLTLKGPASAVLELPSVTSFSLTQYFTEDWFINATVNFSNWNADLTVIKTVIGDITVPLDYSATWYASFYTRYFITKKFALQATATFDHTPTTRVNRSLFLPEGNTVTLGLGFYYKFRDHYSFEFDAGFGFNRDTIVLMNTGTVTQFGIVKDNIYYASFELSYSD